MKKARRPEDLLLPCSGNSVLGAAGDFIGLQICVLTADLV